MTPERSRMSAAVVLIGGLALLLAAGGCASSGGGGSRGSLSAATAAAADDDDEPRTARRRGEEGAAPSADSRANDGNDSYGYEYDGYDDDIYASDDDEGVGTLLGALFGLFSGGGDDGREGEAYADDGAANGGGGDTFAAQGLQFWYSRTWPNGDAIGPISTYTVTYTGISSLGSGFRIGLFYGLPEKGEQPTVAEGVHHFREFGAEVGGRVYMTPDHTLMGLYSLVSLRIGALYWDFQNPLISGGDEINNDTVWFLAPGFGLGVSLLQTDLLHLGLSGEWDLRFMDSVTTEEFENDLYPHRGEWRINLEAQMRF